MNLARAAAALSLLTLTSCGAPQERGPIQHVTLPSRDVQATLPFAPRHAYEAAERCVRDELGYTISASRMDSAGGLGRIDATAPDGASARVLVKPAHVAGSAIVQVFAVPAGARAADVDQAGAILTRIENALWPMEK